MCEAHFEKYECPCNLNMVYIYTLYIQNIHLALRHLAQFLHIKHPVSLLHGPLPKFLEPGPNIWILIFRPYLNEIFAVLAWEGIVKRSDPIRCVSHVPQLG